MEEAKEKVEFDAVAIVEAEARATAEKVVTEVATTEKMVADEVKNNATEEEQ